MRFAAEGSAARGIGGMEVVSSLEVVANWATMIFAFALAGTAIRHRHTWRLGREK